MGPPNKAGLESQVKLYPPFVPPTGEDEDRSAKPVAPVPPAAPLSPHELKNLEAALKGLGVILAAILDSKGQLKADKAADAKAKAAGYLTKQTEEFLARGGKPEDVATNLILSLPYLETQTDFPFLSPQDQRAILAQAGLGDIADRYIEKWNTPRKRFSHFFLLQAKAAEREGKDKFILARFYGQAADFDPKNAELQLEAAKAKMTWLETDKALDSASQQVLLWETFHHAKNILVRDPDNLEALKILKKAIPALGEPSDVRNWIQDDLPVLFQMKGEDVEVLRARKELLLHLDLKDEAQIFSRQLILGQLDAFKNLSAYKAKTLPAEQIRETEEKMEAIADEIKELVDSSGAPFEMGTGLRDVLRQFIHCDPAWAQENQALLDPQNLFTYVSQTVETDHLVQKTQGPAATITDPKEKQAVLFKALGQYAALKNQDKIKETIGLLKESLPPFHAKSHLTDRLELNSAIALVIQGSSPAEEEKLLRFCAEDAEILSNQISMGRSDGTLLSPSEKLGALLSVRNYYLLIGAKNESQALQADLKTARKEAWEQLKSGSKEDLDVKGRVKLAEYFYQANLILAESDYEEVRLKLASREARDHGSSTGPSEADLNSDTVLKEARAVVKRQLEASLVFWKTSMKALGMEHGEAKESDLRFRLDKGQSLLRMTADLSSLNLGGKPLFDSDELQKNIETAREILTPVFEAAMNKGLEEIALQGDSEQKGNIIQGVYLDVFSLLDNIDPAKPENLTFLSHASLEQISDFAKESHNCHEGLLQAQKLLDGKDAKAWIQEIKAGKADSQVLAQALHLFEESAQKFGALGLNDRVEESLQPLIQMAQSEEIPLEERGGILLQVSQTFQAAGMREKTNEILQQAIDLDTPGAPAPVQETAQLARAMQFLNIGKKQEAKDILNALPQNELAQTFLSGLAKSEKQKRDLQCLAVWEAVVADHLGDNPARERVESFSQATQEIRELVLTGKATSVGDAIAKFMVGGRGVVGAKYSEVDNLIKGNTLGTDFTGVQLIQDLKDLGDPQMSDAEFGEKMVFLAKKLAYGSKFYSAGVSVTQIFIEDPQNTDPSALAKAKELAEDIPGEAKFYQIATGIMQLALYALPTGRIAGSVGKGIIGFGAGATVMLADKKYAHDFMKTLPMALGGLAIARLARVGVQSLFLRTTIAEGMSPLARGFTNWALGSAAEAAVLHPANMALEALVNWDTSHLTHQGFGDEFLANFVMFGLFHLNAIGTQRVTRALSKVEKFRAPGAGVAAGGLTPKLRPGIEKALKAFRYTTNLSTFMASDHFNEALGLRPTDEQRTFLAHLVECAKTDFLMHKAGKMADGAIHGATGGKVSLSKTEQKNQIKLMSLELSPGIKNFGLDPKSPAGQLALNILLNRAFAGGESPGEILKSFSEPSLEKYQDIVKTEFSIHDPSSKEGQEIFALLLAYAHDRSQEKTNPLAPEVLQKQLNAGRQKVDSLMKANGVEGPKAEALKNVIMATALQKGLGLDQIEDLAKKVFQAPEFAKGPSELEKSFEAGQRVYPVPPVKDGDPWTYLQTQGEGKEPLAVDQKALQAYLNWSEKKALAEPQKAAEARAQALQPFFDAGVSVLPILNAKGDKPKFKWTAGEEVPTPDSAPSVADYQAFAKWNEAKIQAELAKSKPPVRLAAKRGREAVAPAPPHKMSPASSRQVGDMGNLVGSDGLELPVPLSQGNPAVLTIEGKARIAISTQENGDQFLRVQAGDAQVERGGKSVAADAFGIPLRIGDKIKIGDKVFVWELGLKQMPESKSLPPPTPNARMKAVREAVQGKADGSVQGLAADFGVSDAGGEGSKAFEQRAKASPRIDVKAEAKKMGEVLSVLRESLLPHAENLNAYEMHFFKNDLFQQVMAGKMSLVEAKALAARVSKGEAHIEVQWFRGQDAPADGYKMVDGKAEPYNASVDKGLGIKELQCREYYDHLVRENSEVAKDPKIRELVEAFAAELEKSAGYADSVKGLKAGTHVLTYAEGKIHLQKTADIKVRLDAAQEMAKKVFNEKGVTKIDTKTLDVFLRVVANDPTLTREVYETRFRGIVAALGSLAPRLRALPAEQRAPILERVVRQLAEGKLESTVVEKVLGKGLSKERIAELEGQLGISQGEWLSAWFKEPAAHQEKLRIIDATRSTASEITQGMTQGADRFLVKAGIMETLQKSGVSISTETGKAVDSMIDMVQIAKEAGILDAPDGLPADKLVGLMTTLYLHQSPAVRIGAAELTHVPLVVKGTLDFLLAHNRYASVSQRRVAFVTALFHDAGKWDPNLRTESGYTLKPHPAFNGTGKEIPVKPGETLSEALTRLQDPQRTPAKDLLSAEEAAKVKIPGFLVGVIAHHDASSVKQAITGDLVKQGVLTATEAKDAWLAIERHGLVSSWILNNSFEGIGVLSHVFNKPRNAEYIELYRELSSRMLKGEKVDLSESSQDPKVHRLRVIFGESFTPLERALLLGDHQGQIDIAKYMTILQNSPANKEATIHQLLMGGDRVNSVDGVFKTHTEEQRLLMPEDAEAAAKAFVRADSWLKNMDPETPGLAKTLLADAKTKSAYEKWKSENEGKPNGIGDWLKAEKVKGADGQPTQTFKDIQAAVEKGFYQDYALDEATRGEFKWAPEPEPVPAAKKSLVREAWDESGDIVREDIPPWVRQTFRALVTAFDVPAILGIKIFDGTLERLNEFADLVNELFPIAKSEAKTPEPDKAKPGPARKQAKKPASLPDEEATREVRAPVGEEDTRQVPVKKAARQAVEPDENTRQTRLPVRNQRDYEHSTIVNRPKRSGIREAKGVASEPLTHEEATILAVDHFYLQTFVRDEVIRLNGLEPPKSPVEILEARTAASGASAGKPKLPIEEIELTVATPEGAEKLREYLSKEASEGRLGTKLFPLTLKGQSSSGELILSAPGARDIFVRILSAGDVNQRLTIHRQKVAAAIVAWEESGMRGLAGEVSEAQVKSAREFLAHGDNPPADADLGFMEANGYCYRAKIEGEGRGLLKLYTKEDAGAQAWTVETVEGKKITLIKEFITVVDGEEQSEVVRKVLSGEAIAPEAHPFAEGDAVVFLPQIAGGGPSAQDSVPFTLAAKKDSLDLDPYIHPGSTKDKADFQFMVSFAGVKNGEPQWMLTLGKRPDMPFRYAVEVDGKRVYQERIWVSPGQKIKTADGKVWQFEPPLVDAKHYAPSKWAKGPPPQGIPGDPSAPSPWAHQNPTVKVAARRSAAQPAGPRPALYPSADSLPAKIPFAWDAKAQRWTAVLGRGGVNQGANLFPIPSEVVSRQHAQINIGPNGERILIDLSMSQGSMKSDSHGTWVLEGNQWRKLKVGEEYVLRADQPFALGTMASNGKAAPGEPLTVDKADFSGMEIFYCSEDGFSLKSVHPEDPRLRTVLSPPSEGGLKLVNGDYSFTLPEGDGDTTLGREDFGMGGNSGISAKHAKILTKRGKSFIQDLGSLNGTKVIRNGKLVFSGQDPARKPGYMFQLESGDKVFLGDAIINVF